MRGLRVLADVVERRDLGVALHVRLAGENVDLELLARQIGQEECDQDEQGNETEVLHGGGVRGRVPPQR